MASQGSPAADVRGAQAMELDDVVMTEHRQAEGGDSGSSVRPGARPAQEEPPLRSPSPEEAQKLDDLKALMPSRVLANLKHALLQHGDDGVRRVVEAALTYSLDKALNEAERIHNLRSRTESLPAWLQRLCLDDNGNPRKSKEPKKLFDLFKDWEPPVEDPPSDRTCTRLMLYLLSHGIEKESRIFGEVDQAKLTTLSKAFLAEAVRGSVHLVFLNEIAGFYDPLFWQASGGRFKHYGPTVHVVQSSGTGKSRLVNEICKMLPGISICFRTLEARPGTGYPLGDDAMTRFCLFQTGDDSKKQAAATALLAALLDKLAHETSEVGEASFWREWGLKQIKDPSKPDDAKRSGFFDKVVEKATSLLDEDADEVAKGADYVNISKFTKTLCARWCVEAADALAKRIEEAKKVAARLDQLDEPAREKAKKDAASLDQLDEGACSYFRSKAVLFLGLDEATFLDAHSGIHLIHFRRALFELASLRPKLRIWTILIDTFAGVDTIIDPMFPSSRAVSHPPLPPFVELPFDVFANDHSPMPETASDFLTYSRLRKIGRPLWGTDEESDDGVVLYATSKLFQNASFDTGNADHVVAVLSRRLWLELVVPQEYVGPKQRKDANSTRGDLIYNLSIVGVKSHLRLVTDLDASSRHISTTTGSEPIVSIAAYEALMKPDNYAAALMPLVSDVSIMRKVLNRGELGEFLMRLLLTLARDFAYKEIDTKDRVVPLPTVDFLLTLLGTDFGLSKPEDVEELKRRVENTYISFTHFDAAPRYDKEITARDLLLYWTRTTALQCEHNQMGVDAIIPIYRGSPSDSFDPKSFSYIAFQVKLKQRSTKPTWTVELSTNETPERNKNGKRAADADASETIPSSQSEPAFAIASVKGNVWGPAIFRANVDRERPLVIVMDLGVSRDTTPSNRLFIGTNMKVSTSIAASKTLEEDREARQVSPDVHGAELKKLAQEWLCKHHGQSTADFAALHVPSLKDTYRGLFFQALGYRLEGFLNELGNLLTEDDDKKARSNKPSEARASWKSSFGAHIECVPHC